ncbi:MAG: pyruvoyl-dependent arginine decarboxylase [Candidatus Moraniibacteriota bacterium]
MKITVTWGTGVGSTKLSAFDKALWDAGIANLNLIPLSSVIPPNSEIEIRKLKSSNSEKNFGKRVYVVLSCKTTRKIGKSVYAGIGWRIVKKSRKGLFVEHYGRTEAEVKKLIITSLTDMVKYRKEKYDKIEYKIVGIECKSKPVTALVCAVYKIERW